MNEKMKPFQWKNILSISKTENTVTMQWLFFVTNVRVVSRYIALGHDTYHGRKYHHIVSSLLKDLLHTVNEGHRIVKVQGSGTSTASPVNNIILRVLYGLWLHFFHGLITSMFKYQYGVIYIKLNNGIVNWQMQVYFLSILGHSTI